MGASEVILKLLNPKNVMDINQLNATLRGLAGHLVIETDEQQSMLERLYSSLAKTSLPDDAGLLKNSNFSIEKADLFFEEKISSQRLGQLNLLAENLEEEPSLRVFVREVPLREQLIYGSIPSWAGGASVNHSVGPFQNIDGRQFWFDFYLIEKLIALYIQGNPDPVLLFKVRQGQPIPTNLELPIGFNQLRNFNLAGKSIWIKSSLLAPNAPSGTYTGLSIKNGKVSLSIQAQVVNNKLTAPPNTTVTVQLNLDQPEVANVDESSPFGIDARNMALQLPQTLKFHFSAQGSAIDEAGNADWQLYGQSIHFNWNGQQQPGYETALQRILIPFNTSEQSLEILNSESEFNFISQTAAITRSAWALPVGNIDINQPVPAAGIGGMMVQCGIGLDNKWQGLKGDSLRFTNPVFLVHPGQILLASLAAASLQAHQSFALWKDELNEFGTAVKLSFPSPTLFFYLSNANGNELFMCLANADFQVDRPVKVNGEPPAVHSLNSLLLVAVNTSSKLIYLFDDNLIQDNAQLNNQDPIIPGQMALAMSNALFKVTQVNGCLLFGTLSDDYARVEKGFFFLTFGLYAYLPTLPDPYAANLGILRRQIRGIRTVDTGVVAVPNTAISSWLVSRVKWDPPAEDDGFDEVEVSFHFAPLANQFAGISLADDASSSGPDASNEVQNPAGSNNAANANNQYGLFVPLTGTAASTTSTGSSSRDEPLEPYGRYWDDFTSRFTRDIFALLDVSTNADLFGISFNVVSSRTGTSVTTHVPFNPQTANAGFPIQVEGIDVVSPALNVRVFTVPQISWEPVFNLTPPQPGADPGDPSVGFNYYPNDGGPMHILNASTDSVALAPIPLTNFLLENFENDDTFGALTFFTLPFGIKAVAFLQNQYQYFDQQNNQTLTRRGSEVLLNAMEFGAGLKGGLQMQLNAGEAFLPEESDSFIGSTVQINNVLELDGTAKGDSTLGKSVTKIFNQDFFALPPDFPSQRGVPLTRIDLSGYGASTFSNWLNPKATIAETSQARFDVFVGRCAHEIIQVKSIMYPWAIKVVRTITLFRVSSGYVYRFDTGWQPESDGEFFLNYYINVIDNGQVKKYQMPTFSAQDPGSAFDPGLGKYEIHPGIIKGLYFVKDIQEAGDIAVYNAKMTSAKMVDKDGLLVDNTDLNDELAFSLQPVYFNADVDIENAVSGFVVKKVKGVDRKLVPSKKILGYVQISPKGLPLSSAALRGLILQQLNAIGGPIDCEIDLAGSGQKMRLNRFDFNNSFGANGTDITFAVAGRGNVLLPKDGAWSMVKHERDSGAVSPAPSNLSVPVVRAGKLVRDGATQKLDTPIADALLRIANPTELLRQPAADTLNFGFLQSTDTQKALFLTPSFELGKKKLYSKTPPLFVDAFRIVNSKAVFPNIGNAENDLGDAISLIKNGNEFLKGTLQDIGKDVWEVMDVADVVNNAKQQGFELLKKVSSFDLPDQEFELIDTGDGNFRIYIEYKAKKGNGDVKGDLDFNISSAALDIADTWKSRMGNIGLVVDLAGINRLITIRGNWDSKKGSEAAYPQPEIEFADELKPVIEILEILQKLQGGDYAGAVASGLKLAMSNKAGSWEYKFEATKEIPVLRFPVPDAVYNDPNTPFKLEAGLTIGAYFNAAIKVTTDANELLPSAGGLLGFYGRLSVMCVSISAATIYAIGQVNLDIAADTKIGPSLRMKFGFGAQIVIGLPVAGNVSVLFVVGVEIFAAIGIIELTAFMLFEGHAEILGGIVAITIRIEAKGTVSKKTIGGGSRTDLACQVTFGLDISIFLVINISFSTSWQEQRQIS